MAGKSKSSRVSGEPGPGVETDSAETGASAFAAGSLLRSAASRLEAAGVEDARRSADWMLGDVLGVDRAHLHGFPELSVSTEAVRAFGRMVELRAAGEPLQYVLGYAEFYGLRFEVNPCVLIPRPETELLVERSLTLLQGPQNARVLDVGTGSGCVAIALARGCSGVRLTACDVSVDALAVARRNADRHSAPIQFVEADVCRTEFAGLVGAGFDLIVSNPPYIPSEEMATLPPEVKREPSVALDAGVDPLHFYRSLSDIGTRLLQPSAAIVVEVHADFAADVAGLLSRADYRGVKTSSDLFGRPRVVEAIWAGR